MSRFSESISTIQSNIFTLTPLFVSFYKNLKPKDYNMLLAYFVLPITLNSKCVDEILELRGNSRLSRITDNKSYMAGFHDSFEYYKEITNDCIQYAIDCRYFRLNDKMTIEVINDNIRNISPSLKGSMELASKLPNIFTLDVVNTYVRFGIKGL